MEIKNAIFQDLEVVEKRGFSNWLWKYSKIFVKWMKLSVVLSTAYFMFLPFTFIIRNIIHQKIIKCIVEKSVFLLLWGF